MGQPIGFVAVNAFHGVGSNHGVYDSFFNCLHSPFEQRVDLVIGELFYAHNTFPVKGACVRCRKGDKNVAGAILAAAANLTHPKRDPFRHPL